MEREFAPDLQKCIEFHGHFCPGLGIGYRAVKAALSRLEVERAADEELLAIVESDGCGIDAVPVLSGCTIGKGNLIYKDYGKQAYTIACRKTNWGVRVALKNDIFAASPEQERLSAAFFSDQATKEEQAAFQQMQKERIDRLFSLPEEELFKIENIELQLPSKAKIFKSVVCDYCGEKVMEPRARLKDGKVACLGCFEDYTRGW